MTPLNSQSLPADVVAELARLRDIRLPEDVSWWPLAPGWWALLAIVLIASVAVAGLELRRRRSLRFQALRELELLKAQTTPKSSTLELASQICVLIRRIALSGIKDQHLASIHGDAWSEYLSQSPHGMPPPIATFIAGAPYVMDEGCGGESPQSEPGKDAIFSAAENWIRSYA